MNDELDWNDESPEQLRDTLRRVILGELRLARRGQDEILEACREVHIEEQCPAGESDELVRFAADELGRAAAELETEKGTWPTETDCDRLDRVEVALREKGILLWQVSPCCDTCTVSELGDRIDVINARDPGFGDRVRGYAFFIDQNMPDELSCSTQVTVHLGYGWISPDNSEVAPEAYEKHALAIGREVCQCLRDEGFEADWDGSFSKKIGVSLNWLRRRMLD